MRYFVLSNLGEDLDDTQRHQLNVFRVSEQFTSKEKEREREEGGGNITQFIGVCQSGSNKNSRSAVKACLCVTLTVHTHVLALLPLVRAVKSKTGALTPQLQRSSMLPPAEGAPLFPTVVMSLLQLTKTRSSGLKPCFALSRGHRLRGGKQGVEGMKVAVGWTEAGKGEGSRWYPICPSHVRPVIPAD